MFIFSCFFVVVVCCCFRHNFYQNSWRKSSASISIPLCIHDEHWTVQPVLVSFSCFFFCIGFIGVLKIDWNKSSLSLTRVQIPHHNHYVYIFYTFCCIIFSSRIIRCVPKITNDEDGLWSKWCMRFGWDIIINWINTQSSPNEFNVFP